MATLHIYGHRLSAPSRAVEIYCKLVGLPYDYSAIDIGRGEQTDPSYLSLNPLGQIPAISDGDFTLGESHAILTYLHTEYRGDDSLYPSNAKKRAIVDRYLHWHHTHTRKASWIVFGVIFAPMWCISLPGSFVRDSTADFRKTLAVIEKWLSNERYIAGDKLTIADVSAFQEIYQVSIVNFDLREFPGVQAWISRLQQIPAFREVNISVDEFKAAHLFQSLSSILMANLKLYGHPLSAPHRAVELLCKIAQIPYEFVLVDMPNGEHRKPEFLALNPLGQVPAIVDGDFKLGESHAILMYLHAAYHVSDSLYPADLRKRAKVDQYLHWHHGNMRKASWLVFGLVIAPKFNMPVPPSGVQDRESTVKSLATMEQWLSSTAYVAGDEMTIADLSAFQEVYQLTILDFPMDPYPHVHAWVQRLLEIPSFRDIIGAVDGYKAQHLAEQEQKAKEQVA